MSFNRFIGGADSAEATSTPDVPSAEFENSDAGSEIDPVTGKKQRKTRDKKNVTITREQKSEMLKRYASETPAAIARDMGVEARQVYNAVRHARIKLKEAFEAELDPKRKAELEAALAKIPHKEFGGGAAGPRSNTLTEDDIIASLLG
jgi:pyruvate/2-oxoglutarate dehydrogenase complex dihydrolipoamide acyltransferase (E2) component